MLKITLVKSTISETPRNRATVHALGLRKTHKSVIQEDTPVIQGMIHHVKHLLKVETVEGVVKVRKRQGKNPGLRPEPVAKPAKAAKPVSAEPKSKKPTTKKTPTTKKES